jgi:hypothetical protein
MSAFGGPNIQPNGLAFYYDMTNRQKSFIGSPTTNLIPNPNSGVNVTSTDVPIDVQDKIPGYFSASSGYNVIDWAVTSTAATGVTFTSSVYMRSPGEVSTFLMYIFTGTGPDGGWYGPLSGSLTSSWQRYAATFSGYTGTITTMRIYRVNSLGTIEIAAPQLEVGSFATPFVTGTRSNTQAIRDLTNNNTITATSLTYASDGTFSFNGSNFITIPNTTLGNGTTPWTVSAWVKTTTTTNDLGNGSVMSNSSGGPVYSMMGVNSGRIVYWTYQSSAWAQKLGVRTVNDNNWHMLTWINYDNNTMDMYVDGTLDANVANSTSGNNNPVDRIGGSWSAQFVGSIASVSRYTRALTATEVRQNFNAVRTRYGV